MRRLFTITGDLDREQQLRPPHPDEVVTEQVRLRMRRFPDETFRQAKQQVLRENPALAEDYAKQFG